MKNRRLAALLSAVLLAVPVAAAADFNDQSARAKAQTAALSQAELDNLNSRVIMDAYLVARIIGYDPAEVRALRSEVTLLRQENAQLETRVSELENSFTGIRTTLMQVISMLTALLGRMS